MAGEDHFKSGIGKLGGNGAVILNKIHLENVRLHGEMRNKAVVRKADDVIPFCLGCLYLLGCPCNELGTHFAACFVLIVVIRRVVGAVAAGVERDKRYTLARLCNV